MKKLLLAGLCALLPAHAVAQTKSFKPYAGEYGSTVRSSYGVEMPHEFWWDELMTCSVRVGVIGSWLSDKDQAASQQFIKGAQYIGAAALKRAALDSGSDETMIAQTVVGPFAELSMAETNSLMAEAEEKGEIDALVHSELGRCDSLVGQYIAAYPADLPPQ